ncbi:type II toxin-antitoxin system VapC family toxin [Halorientalis pallida]|jgi:predicted nucleic acid-binding protein|uniref:Ribonuclease VapC n=1 Tax=Halorientalis pallida TaxID=2479928 RepID=A0A498KXF4_9EURY|nr:type II toxin-antitoxin system VapC family toxin [Halorientalis pallida]RXK47452.1 type II toxin-antitoxin system VapC family toxin [Halorientalis pallida]
MIVLDTDVLVEYARPNSDPAVTSYLTQRTDEQWIVPSVGLYEYLSFYGSQSRRRTERKQVESRVDAVLPLDTDAALEASDIENLLSSSGTSLDPGDLLIAAIARSRNATLATRNKNDFDKQPVHQLMDVDIVR